MEDNMKIVNFNEYCETCKHQHKTENDDPCNECLTIPAREYSHKPEFWEGK